MRNLQNIWIVILVLKYSSSSLGPATNRFKAVSSFLKQQSLFRIGNEEVVVGALILNSSIAAANDILTEWLFEVQVGTIPGIKIMTEFPKGCKMPTFTDTIVFLDHINENINATIHTFINERYPEKVWFRDSRYIFIQPRIISKKIGTLQKFIKLLWTDTKLLNFIFICILDSMPDLQVLGYNPFRDEFQSFSSSQNYSYADFFPNKMSNLYGYSINVAYKVFPPFVIEVDGRIGGSDYDFAMTFLQKINASAEESSKESYDEIAADMSRASVDMVAMGFFLYEYFVEVIGYPHAFVDVVVFVEKAKPVSAFTTVLYIFDEYIWMSIILVGICFRAVKLMWFKLFSLILEGNRPDTGLKILVFALSIFNIIMTQTFQILACITIKDLYGNCLIPAVANGTSTMGNLRIIWKIIFIFLKYSHSSLLPETSRFKEVSSFLRKQPLFPDRDEGIVVGVLLLNKSNAEANDILTAWLLELQVGMIPGIKIMSKMPKSSKMPTFTDTIVLLDYIDENFIPAMYTFINESSSEKAWFRDSRYIFVQSRIFNETLDSLKYRIKTLWTHLNLLNFIFICILDSTPDLQALGYHPFKDEFTVFSLKQRYRFQDFFPNKMKNLYGNSLNIAYKVSPPFITETINATAKEKKHKTYEEITADMSCGLIDMIAMGFFLSEFVVEVVGYPHAFVDVLVYVEKAKPASAFTTILYIFDKQIWMSIIFVGICFWAVKIMWFKLFAFILENNKPNTGLKLLIIVWSIFNIIMTQMFQSWITTFLIYPKQGKDINTVEELADSKLPVYSISMWSSLLTDKLKNQYVFYNDAMAFFNSPVLPEKGAYVISSDVIISYNFSQKYHYLHQVKESVGTAYSVFYLGPFAPYKNILKNFTLRSLAYGYTSKYWGFYRPIVTDNTHVTQKLQLNHVIGIFLMWTVGLVLSTSAFAIELLWFRYEISTKIFRFMKQQRWVRSGHWLEDYFKTEAQTFDSRLS